MKKTLAFTTWIALLFILIPSTLDAERRAPFASGSGQVHVDGEHRTFAFQARVDDDGVVRGGAIVINRTSDVRLLMVIDCMRIDANVATFSGVHRYSSEPTYEEQPFWFQVVDNGEGNGDPADEMTLVYTFPGGFGPTCQEDYPADRVPLEGGNIQIHE